jgi:16S rRNA (guanine527-N7)-methyltransferase
MRRERAERIAEPRFLRHLRDNTWRPMPATGNAVIDPQTALESLSADWGFRVEPEQRASLVQFADLLIRWNQSINLTGAASVGIVVAEHYPDAYALARRLDGRVRLVDVGSGGGLPALPLALLRPELRIRLCEPIAKKAAFLRTAIRELNLADRVELEARRAEELADELATAPSLRFDVATSRATFAPEVWLALGRRLVRPGGRVFILTVPGTAIDGTKEIYGEHSRALIEVQVEGRA